MKIIFFLFILSVIPPAIISAGAYVIVFQNPIIVPILSSLRPLMSVLMSYKGSLSWSPENPYASLIKFLDQLNEMRTSDYKKRHV